MEWIVVIVIVLGAATVLLVRFARTADAVRESAKTGTSPCRDCLSTTCAVRRPETDGASVGACSPVLIPSQPTAKTGTRTEEASPLHDRPGDPSGAREESDDPPQTSP